MAVACHSKTDLLKWNEDGNKLYAKWRNDKAIRKRYTNNNEFLEDSSMSGFKEWMREKMGIPFHEDLPFTKEQFNLAE